MNQSLPKPVCVRKQCGRYEAFISKHHPNKVKLIDGFYRYSYLIPNNTALTWSQFGQLIKAHCSHPSAQDLAQLMEVDA